MKIGYIGTQQGGIAYYRGPGALSRIEGVKVHKFTNESIVIEDTDLLFASRPFDDNNADLVSIAKSAGIPVVIDIDDDLFNVNIEHPNYPEYCHEHYKRKVYQILGEANHIFVSTKSISNTLSNLGLHNVSIIHNAIDPSLLFNESFSKPSIHWRGSSTHIFDLQLYEKPIVEAVNKANVEFHAWGHYPSTYFGKLNKATYHPPEQFYSYLAKYIKHKPTVAVVPLADNKFNRGKSNIAWLEATAAGAVCVSSYLPEFDQTGVLCCQSDAEWYENILMIVKDQKFRRNLFNYSKEVITDKFNINKTNKLRMEIFNELTGA